MALWCTILLKLSLLLLRIVAWVREDKKANIGPGRGKCRGIRAPARRGRGGVQRRHDPRKNDLRASGFAELPPGPAELVSQPP